VLYKKEAMDLQIRLSGRGYNVTGIHGDKSQADRTGALEEFKSGRIPLLIATDVAARGLDIPQVEVIYFIVSCFNRNFVIFCII
jgi:ATP-dependent RNA helicase DBP3